jgi:spermidine synthase
MQATGRSGFRTRALLLLLFTLSGASALVYEVLWTRRLTHVFGSTTLAASTVLAAFMLGLAAGSVALGRWADRNRNRALRAYGLLEIAIGAYGFAVPYLLRGLERAYVSLAPLLESFPMLYFVAQFFLAGAVLAVPCVLMGGTLPVLARWIVLREDELGARVGALYAANTLGAGLGAAAATYVLLPAAGVRASELSAVALNLAAGLAALALAGRGARVREAGAAAPPETGESPAAGPAAQRALLAAIALSGFAAMVDEVTWTRLVGLIFGSSVYAFGLMLLLFLAGLAVGSALYVRLRRIDPSRVLGVALAANTFAALAGIALVPRLPYAYMRAFPAVQGAFAWDQALQVLTTAPALLPIAVLFGVAFPAAVAATADLASAGRGVGRVTAWNTLGTVGGAFLGGFVLIPRLGLRASLTIAAAATALGAVLALSRPGLERARRRTAIAATAAVLAALALPAWPHGLLARGAGFYASIYGTSEGLREADRDSELLFYEDGIATTLSVDRQGPYRFYRSNGKTDASTETGDMTNQLLLGHLPMLRHPAPADVFVLGLGTGVSAASVARYPVRSIDIADIEGASQRATQMFAPENRGILSDPRVRMLVADGRNALLVRDQTYDVIISDPSDVWVAGVGSLFTREFYELARRRLKPGGLIVQWFHMHSLPPDQMKLIVATFRSVFPSTSLWRPNRGDVILMGSVEPVPWDLARLRQRFENVPGVAEDLRPYGFWHPLSIFAAFVLDGEDLDRMLADTRGLHADDRPVVEYLAPRAERADTTSANDAGVQALQTKALPPIAGFDENRDLDARARYLLGFGLASIGRVDPGIRLMEESVRGEKPDPDFLVGLANQYRAKGWTAKAAAAYERALGLEAGHAEASLRLAEVLRSSGDDAGAERVLRTALRRTSGDAALAAAAARLLLDGGRTNDALAVLAPALGKAPADVRLRLLDGESLAGAGRAEDAAAILRTAASEDPENAETQRRAGELLLALGDFEGARAALDRATRLAPDDAATLAGLARAEFARGNAAAGRQARDAALARDPYNAAALALGRETPAPSP